jgi:hypothetical protein
MAEGVRAAELKGAAALKGAAEMAEAVGAAAAREGGAWEAFGGRDLKTRIDSEKLRKSKREPQLQPRQ